jgi:hypothetical protein
MTTTAVRPLTTFLVFDDVLADPHAYRQYALGHAFGDVTLGGQTFKGIGYPVLHKVLPKMVAAVVPGAKVHLTFFRKSPHGQEEPNYIHSDAMMGEVTAILYLNPEPPAGDGTTFWQHVPTEKSRGEFDPEAAKDLSQWAPWEKVDAKFNRLLLFRSDLFHSRSLFENHGEGDEARLTQVAFANIVKGAA